MNQKRQFFRMLVAVYLLFSVSCSTTMNTVWKDENYQGGKFKKIFVIGVAENQTIRRVFEDEFVEKLNVHGTDAITSYSLIPSKEKIDRDTVESKIKIVGADAVIVTRLLYREKRKIYKDGLDYTRGYYRSYSEYHEAVRDRRERGTYYEYEVVSLETNLYETVNAKMIWSGSSETHLDFGPANVPNEDKVVKVIKTLIKTIVARLSNSQLI